jgi:membrane protein DedA with SNARE-associated domain
MEGPRLRSIRNRILAVEMTGLALCSSLSAWSGGGVGLATGAIAGATVGAPGMGAFLGAVLGMGVGYTIGKSLKNSANRRSSVLM